MKKNAGMVAERKREGRDSVTAGRERPFYAVSQRLPQEWLNALGPSTGKQ